MNKNSVTVILKIPSLKIKKEIEIQNNMPVNELAKAIVFSFFDNVEEKEENYYLKCENPIALLRGNKTIFVYGLHNGSIIECDR